MARSVFLSTEEHSQIVPNRQSGLTHKQLQDMQVYPEEVGVLIKGNKNPDYELKDYEQFYTHAKYEVLHFDQGTGQKLSKSRVVKYLPEIFERYEEKGFFGGVALEILHDGSEALEAQKRSARNGAPKSKATKKEEVSRG